MAISEDDCHDRGFTIHLRRCSHGHQGEKAAPLTSFHEKPKAINKTGTLDSLDNVQISSESDNLPLATANQIEDSRLKSRLSIKGAGHSSSHCLVKTVHQPESDVTHANLHIKVAQHSK